MRRRAGLVLIADVSRCSRIAGLDPFVCLALHLVCGLTRLDAFVCIPVHLVSGLLTRRRLLLLRVCREGDCGSGTSTARIEARMALLPSVIQMRVTARSSAGFLSDRRLLNRLHCVVRNCSCTLARLSRRVPGEVQGRADLASQTLEKIRPLRSTLLAAVSRRQTEQAAYFASKREPKEKPPSSGGRLNARFSLRRALFGSHQPPWK